MRNCSCRLLSSGPRSNNSSPSTLSYHSLVRSRSLIWMLMCWINVTLDIASPPAIECVHRWIGLPPKIYTIVPQSKRITIESNCRARNDRPGLLALAYERGHSFAHHQHGRVDGGTHQVGHDRGVDDAQPIQASDLAVLIDHRQRVRARPHLTGAGDMRIRGDLAQQPFIKGRIRGQIAISWFKPRSDDLLEAVVLGQCEGKPHARAQTLPIEGVCQVVIVQKGLSLWITGCQPEFT